MTIIFVDSLGGIKYPEVMAKLPKKYGSGYFYEEFGLAKKQIELDIKTRVFSRTQALWAGKSHNYTDDHRKKSIQIAVALNAIAGSLGKQHHYSPFCEHKKNKAYMTSLLTEIKNRCPHLIPVNSPVSGGEWVDGFVNEIHHYDKPPGMPKGQFIFSMDGLHQPDCDITEFFHYLDNPNCIAFGVWAIQDNCKPNAKPENNIPPKTRKCKPTPELHESMIVQVENRKLDLGEGALENGFIFKTHSEQHHDVDPRANKIVAVGPKGKRFKSASVGKIKLTDGGFTEDKRQTWRSNKWSYKQGRKAVVKFDGKSKGTIDFLYRQNEYRKKT